MKLRFNSGLLMLLTIPVLPSPEWVLIQLSFPFANIEKTNQEQTPLIGWKIIGLSIEYSAKDEHPDRFELNSAAAQIEQSNRRN